MGTQTENKGFSDFTYLCSVHPALKIQAMACYTTKKQISIGVSLEIVVRFYCIELIKVIAKSV